MSDHQQVHFKYLNILFANYTSIKLKQKWKKISSKFYGLKCIPLSSCIEALTPNPI